MVIGPIVGLLFGCVILFRGPSTDVAGIDTLDQPRFERAAAGLAGGRREENMLEAYAGDKPFLKDLVVHPPLPGEKSNLYWITGKVLSAELDHENRADPKTKTVLWGDYRPFRYPAPIPYHAVAVARGTYDNVMVYLNNVKKNEPRAAASYSYAWWDYTLPTLLLPALAGFLMIGVAWPMTIHLMQGAGLAKLPEPKKAKLPKSKPAKAKAAVDHSAADARLDELNTQLEEDLAAGATAHGPAAAAATVEAPVKALTASPAETAATAAAEQERLIREYGGEFYPVAKTAHKEPDTPAPKPAPNRKSTK
jgi:hypothetical protein